MSFSSKLLILSLLLIFLVPHNTTSAEVIRDYVIDVSPDRLGRSEQIWPEQKIEDYYNYPTYVLYNFEQYASIKPIHEITVDFGRFDTPTEVKLAVVGRLASLYPGENEAFRSSFTPSYDSPWTKTINNALEGRIVATIDETLIHNLTQGMKISQNGVEKELYGRVEVLLSLRTLEKPTVGTQIKVKVSVSDDKNLNESVKFSTSNVEVEGGGFQSIINDNEGLIGFTLGIFLPYTFFKFKGSSYYKRIDTKLRGGMKNE